MDSFDFEKDFALSEAPDGATPLDASALERPWYDPRRYFGGSGADATTPLPKGEYALSLYDEGNYLHAVVLRRNGKEVHLVESQRYRLGHSLDSVDSVDELIVEVDGAAGDFENPLDLGDDFEPASILSGLEVADDEPPPAPQATGFFELIRRYGGRKTRIAITVAEPAVFYVHFDRRLDKDRDKSNMETLLSDISKQRPYADKLEPEQLHAIDLADGRTTAVIRETRLNHIDLLEQIRPGISRQIAFVESAETALMNFLALRREIPDDEVNLIVHIGHDYSRLIFMKGNQPMFVSDKVDTYMEGNNLAMFLNRNIQVELLKGNLDQPRHVYLSGEAAEMHLAMQFRDLFHYLSNTEIQFLDYPLIGVETGDLTASQFAVPLASALRALAPKAPFIIPVDFTPDRIRQQQKRFTLGLAGWLLLLMIPLVVAGIYWKVGQLEYDLNKLKTVIAEHRGLLADLEAVDARVTEQKARMVQYEAALSTATAMGLGTTPWTDRLNTLINSSKKIGGIWLTEVKRKNGEEIHIFGFATDRTCIPRFVRAIGDGTLMRVEVQSIRAKTVYFFEVTQERIEQ